MELIELIENIRSLSKSWGLLDNGDLGKQSLKIREEVGEFCRAYLRNDREGMKDAIGDIAIAVINYRLMRGESVDSIGNEFVPFYAKGSLSLNRAVNYIYIDMDLYAVYCLSVETNFDLMECLEHSYNQIKSRTGRMVDGCFVKDGEPENDLLQECLLQLEYLSRKFGETGTGNNLISKLKSHLNLNI